jgi:MFS family permease
MGGKMSANLTKKKFLNIPLLIWPQLLALALGFSFYSANRLAFALGLKSIATQLALTVVQVGILGTIFTLGQALIDVPAGYLADKLGRKKMLVTAMFCISLTTLAVTTANGFISAAIWRFLFGASEGIWNIVIYSVAGSIFPASRAMLNGLMISFYSVGAYVGPAYYGWTLDTHPGNWQFGLLTMGSATFLFATMLWIGLKAKYTDTSKDIKTMHLIEALKRVGINRCLWYGIALAILNIIPYWGFASMGPYLFMTYKGFSASEAGQFFGIVYGIGGLSSVFLGYLADKLGRKPVILVLAVLNLICSYLILHQLSHENLVLLYIVAGILGIGLHVLYMLGYTVGQDTVPVAQMGLATGLLGACMYFSSFFSGPMTGYLTKTLGHITALDIILVAFQFAIIILGFIMPETCMHKQKNDRIPTPVNTAPSLYIKGGDNG